MFGLRSTGTAASTSRSRVFRSSAHKATEAPEASQDPAPSERVELVDCGQEGRLQNAGRWAT